MTKRPLVDLELHRRRRRLLRQHHNAVVATIPTPLLRRVATEFGLLDGNTLLLETDDELTIFFDHLIYDRPRQGMTPVERYLAALPPPENDDERLVRQAMAGQQYSVYEVVRVHKGTGALMRDLLRGADRLVVDEALSRSTRAGALMAGRQLPMPDYWMPSGGGFPVGDDAVETALEVFAAKVKRDVGGEGTLSREDEQRLAAVVVGEGFDDGSTTLIQYR